MYIVEKEKGVFKLEKLLILIINKKFEIIRNNATELRKTVSRFVL